MSPYTLGICIWPFWLTLCLRCSHPWRSIFTHWDLWHLCLLFENVSYLRHLHIHFDSVTFLYSWKDWFNWHVIMEMTERQAILCLEVISNRHPANLLIQTTAEMPLSAHWTTWVVFHIWLPFFHPPCKTESKNFRIKKDLREHLFPWLNLMQPYSVFKHL